MARSGTEGSLQPVAASKADRAALPQRNRVRPQLLAGVLPRDSELHPPADRVLGRLIVVGLFAFATLTSYRPLLVVAAGEPPVAFDQTETTREAKPLEIQLLADDPEFDPLTFTILTQPTHGILTDDCSDGVCTYTPDTGSPNYTGPDSFTWRASDGTTDSNAATVSISVTANQLPVAADQEESTREAKPLVIGLAVGDDDGDELTITIINQPLHGTVDDCPSGICTYTPDTGYTGPDSFTWKANDGLADSNTATVTISVTPNQAPAANSSTRLLREVAPVNITLPAMDADGDLLTFTIVSPPTHGTLDDCSSGSCTYTPGASFTTSDSFTWKANDGLADSNTATMSLRLVASPLQLAQAMAADASIITGASYVAFPPQGTPNDVYSSGLSSFPTAGSSFSILTSGDASLADDPNVDAGSGANDSGAAVRGNTDLDVTVLKVDLSIASGVNCLRFDFAFYSEEFPEFVGGAFNDAFIAELDTSSWTTAGSTITAPDNFAFDPTGDVISVNSTGATSMSEANAVGTTYDGATQLLQAGTQVTPGAHSLYLSIFDQGDRVLDSAVFLDNLRVLTLPQPETQCAEGAVEANTPPSIDAGGPYTGSEGSQVTLDGTVTDPDAGDIVSTSWSFTPGAGVDPGAQCTFGSASAVDTTVSCNDDGSYTLTLTASDGVNPPVSDTATLTLTNAAPGIAINSPSEGASVGVGASVSLNATVADAGGNDTLTCSIDWDDGTVAPGVVADGFCTGSHAYTTAGPYTISATVSDDDGGSAIDSVNIVVTPGPNTPPTVDAGGPYTSSEGSSVTLDGMVSDPDTGDTVTTTWSFTPDAGVDAGATCTFGSASTVDTSVSCTDDGSYILTLTANDGSGPVTDTAILTLANANPTVSITSPSEGASFGVDADVPLTATISDAGANDTHICSIDWGDGSPAEAGTVATGSCSGSHAYATADAYTISVMATDDDGGTGNDSVGIVVTAPELTADLSVTKLDTPDPVTSGNNVRYAVTVSNAGPDAATNVMLIDMLPAGTTTVQVDPRCTLNGSVLTCALGEIQAEGSTDVEVVVRMPTVTALTQVTNTVGVGAEETDPNTENNSASAQTSIEPAPSDPDSASGWIPAGGGRVTTGAEKPPSKKDPMTTEVVVPPGFPGLVTISEGPITSCPEGFRCFGQEADITAPTTTAATPLRLTFSFHPSALPPSTQLHEVVMFHDDVLVERCTGAPAAVPDPCIASVTRGMGAIQIVVLSSENGTWRGGR